MSYKWKSPEQNRLIYKTAVEHNLWIVVSGKWYHPDKWFKLLGSKPIPLVSRNLYKLRNPINAFRKKCSLVSNMIEHEPDRSLTLKYFELLKMFASDLAEWGFKETEHQIDEIDISWIPNG